MEPRGWHSRGYLPHYDDWAKTQFLTFNLADALPRKLVQQWQDELERTKFVDRQRLLRRRVEKYLDLGEGECYLRRPEIAEMVIESLHHQARDYYKLYAWTVMPNHLHYLLRPLPGISLSLIMKRLKSYTAHRANKMLNRTGQFWHEDYWDRYIRNERHLLKVIEYIDNNPVKAGLCVTPGEWPYGSAWAGTADGLVR